MSKQRIPARAQAQYTDYLVKEPMELMAFLAARMPQASRTKLKALLSKRVVYVDNVITTQYNFPLQPGMKVQISREKGNKEFHNRLLKIVYEDAYLLVVEKAMQEQLIILKTMVEEKKEIILKAEKKVKKEIRQMIKPVMTNNKLLVYLMN